VNTIPQNILTTHIKNAKFHSGNLKGKYHLGDICKSKDNIKGDLSRIGWEGWMRLGPTEFF
jgi:hypothetical protein